MLFGYMRVSTEDQKFDRQLDQLEKVGVEKIYKEKITGTKRNRPELNKMLEGVRKGDTIVISDLTRISRSTKDLFNLVSELDAKGVNIRSLKESWLNTATAQGKLMFTMLAGLSQFERDLISERTKEGLKSARARGHFGGRPKTKQSIIDTALVLWDSKKYTSEQISQRLDISKRTLFNYIAKRTELK